MKEILPEYEKQPRAGCEPNILKASFIERRLFYLKTKMCYKGM
jgi:hypothetical protein